MARNVSEVEFLTIGDGARLWLTEAAAAGTTKIRVKMAQAVTLAKLFEAKEVDWALGHAAVHARFAEADLASILDHHHPGASTTAASRAGEDGSLTQGTTGWAALGTPTTGPATDDTTGATTATSPVTGTGAGDGDGDHGQGVTR